MECCNVNLEQCWNAMRGKLQSIARQLLFCTKSLIPSSKFQVPRHRSSGRPMTGCLDDGQVMAATHTAAALYVICIAAVAAYHNRRTAMASHSETMVQRDLTLSSPLHQQQQHTVHTTTAAAHASTITCLKMATPLRPTSTMRRRMC